VSAVVTRPAAVSIAASFCASRVLSFTPASSISTFYPLEELPVVAQTGIPIVITTSAPPIGQRAEARSRSCSGLDRSQQKSSAASGSPEWGSYESGGPDISTTCESSVLRGSSGLAS
jgi:hypothetical protein